jgi:PAT family beta-lactamase induction signal transducer AmpG
MTRPEPALPASPPPPAGARHRLAALHRWIVVAVLGFASGLPLALSGQALQAWLTIDGFDVARIGFLSLVGLPYTFKFLWAPLIDRWDPPLLGRRRGWIVITQLALVALLLGMAAVDPKVADAGDPSGFALNVVFTGLALALAFSSASQDVVIDAYRTDLLPARERGMGSSLTVMGYRLAMILSGGVALIWTDTQQGGGMSWPHVYRIMAALMAGAAVFSLLALPKLPPVAAAAGEGAAQAPVPLRRDLLGFLAVVAAVAAGVWFTSRVGGTIGQAVVGPFFGGDAAAGGALARRWVELVALLAGLAFTLPLAAWAAKKARFDTLLSGLGQFFSQPHAKAFLAFVVFYKLTDAFAMSLLTPFLLQGMHFTPAEVGVVNKVIGLGLTLLGALLGGMLMLRLRLVRALMVFGVLQMLSNAGFWWLAVNGKGAAPGLVVPAFDIWLVRLVQPTPVDGGLLLAVAGENLASGMGTAAILAFLMSLTNRRFTATQFALLSAFVSIGRVWVGPLAGVLAQSIGWPSFFVVAMAMALPSLAMLAWLWRPIDALDRAGDDA